MAIGLPHAHLLHQGIHGPEGDLLAGIRVNKNGRDELAGFARDQGD